MTLITFFGQIMVFIVVFKDPRLRTPGSYFIVSLATADFLISIISMPVWTIYSTIGYWPVSQVSHLSFFSFFKKFLADTCPFLGGHWYPCLDFW